MSSSYRPRVGSIPHRVIEWLRANPEEELSRADVAEKFDLSHTSVQACLSDAVKAGALAYVQGDDTVWVYRLGGTGATTPFAGLVSQPTAQVPDPKPTAELLRELRVDSDVPIKKPKPDPDAQWEPLLERLRKPGDSAQIPMAWKRGLQLAVRRRHNRATGDKSSLPTFKVGNDHNSPHARI